ncbi:MAG: roadblock/LC7 domain-containing protein [Chitinispirillaceae bacterium]
MKDMILFPEDLDLLNSVLQPLTQKANLLLAVLINKDGRLLTSQGLLDSVDIVSLAALVAGNSASTLAIANLMGETEFCTMYHQGKDKHIYISNVDENTFLALVFDDRTNIDRVKVFARQFDRQLKESLLKVYDKSEDQIDLDLDMGNSFFPGQNQTQQPQQYNDYPQTAPGQQQQAQYQQTSQSDVFYLDMSQTQNGSAGQNQNPPQQQINDDSSVLFLQKKIKESQHKRADS